MLYFADLKVLTTEYTHQQARLFIRQPVEPKWKKMFIGLHHKNHDPPIQKKYPFVRALLTKRLSKSHNFKRIPVNRNIHIKENTVWPLHKLEKKTKCISRRFVLLFKIRTYYQPVKRTVSNYFASFVFFTHVFIYVYIPL